MSRHPLPLYRDALPIASNRPLGKLVDRFGRGHNNLRISVTDRCNLRCVYCMPEDVVFRDRSELLTFEEIEHLVRVAVPLGIDKVRLTGGEPLLRRGMPDLVARLAAIPGLKDLGLTTNGILLAQQAKPLYDAGLRRLNVSLDTLDPARFRELARRDGLEKVLEGLQAAKEAGFSPIKVNALAMRETADDCVPLADFARRHGYEMRFIEYMPIGSDSWAHSQVFLAEELLGKLEAAFGHLRADPDNDPHSPARDYLYADGGRVGIIASVSRPFCRTCNRLRLTAEGKLRHCLFALDETDLRPFLRNLDDVALIQAIHATVDAKWEGHEINSAAFIKPDRIMHAIGG